MSHHYLYSTRPETVDTSFGSVGVLRTLWGWLAWTRSHPSGISAWGDSQEEAINKLEKRLEIFGH